MLWVSFILFPLVICSYLDLSLNVYILERKKTNHFGIRLSWSLLPLSWRLSLISWRQALRQPLSTCAPPGTEG